MPAIGLECFGGDVVREASAHTYTQPGGRPTKSPEPSLRVRQRRSAWHCEATAVCIIQVLGDDLRVGSTVSFRSDA
jgi:hypothetical protein